MTRLEQALSAILKKLESHSAIELIAIYISQSKENTGSLPPSLWVRIIVDQANETRLSSIRKNIKEIQQEFDQVSFIFLVGALPVNEIAYGVPQGFKILYRRKK